MNWNEREFFKLLTGFRFVPMDTIFFKLFDLIYLNKRIAQKKVKLRWCQRLMMIGSTGIMDMCLTAYVVFFNKFLLFETKFFSFYE